MTLAARFPSLGRFPDGFLAAGDHSCNSLAMFNAERVEKLLNDLIDYHDADGSFSSASGATGYEPATDFPVCRRAVEELVAMGDSIVPRMLEVVASNNDVQAFFVAEILGRLGAVEAIGPLEKLVRSGAWESRRVNYDQYIEYHVYEQAFEALSRIDKARALGALRHLAESDARWGKHWANAKLAELT